MNFLRSSILIAAILLLFSNNVFSQWLDISNVSIKKEVTEMAGPEIVIEYDLESTDISEKTPAYVFIRFSQDGGAHWNLLPMDYLRGTGFDIITSAGHKKIFWWGVAELGYDKLDLMEIKVRGLQLVRIPGGEFIMKSFPGGGKDPSVNVKPKAVLSEFFIAKNETTISMYADYLNEMGDRGFGWNPRMKDSLKCGIVREGIDPDYTYLVKPQKGNYPINYVSWYDAVSFLDWCGLTLPTETMWEKAYVGGIYLDGDDSKLEKNPLPVRKYPWGNEAPDADALYRCNYEGIDDGFSKTSPVGSFSKYDSPYGVSDLAGNVAEWTLDWYTTTFHVGIDGFRMVRGGSRMDLPFACDAVSGATQFPIKESNIIGFRGVK